MQGARVRPEPRRVRGAFARSLEVNSDHGEVRLSPSKHHGRAASATPQLLSDSRKPVRGLGRPPASAGAQPRQQRNRPGRAGPGRKQQSRDSRAGGIHRLPAQAHGLWALPSAHPQALGWESHTAPSQATAGMSSGKHWSNPLHSCCSKHTGTHCPAAAQAESQPPHPSGLV